MTYYIVTLAATATTRERDEARRYGGGEREASEDAD